MDAEASGLGLKDKPPHVLTATTEEEVGPSRPTWNPCCYAFGPYLPPSTSYAGTSQSQQRSSSSSSSSSLRVIVKKPLVARLTKDIVETYQICNPAFKYSEAINLKRFLTNPSVGVLNDGFDNANSDLILTVNFVLVNDSSQQRYEDNFEFSFDPRGHFKTAKGGYDPILLDLRYIVKDILGQGTFGQVAKCWVSETNSYVAVKIIKNQPAYYQQALVEVAILTTLNQKFDPDEHHIVRILDYFVYHGHLCISFEVLGSNLYELIRTNDFRGLPLSIVQLFSKQILHALVVMKEAGIIHCDLKPENILLSTSVRIPEVRIIDFGSACMENRTVYTYIQSRYYRSPEVVLGYQYTTAIDMWSLGCIVAELFLGVPLFPGASEFDLLKRMIEILGPLNPPPVVNTVAYMQIVKSPNLGQWKDFHYLERGQPPDHILRLAKNTPKFFKCVGSIHWLEEDELLYVGSKSAYQMQTEEEYEAKESKKPVVGKRHFNFVKLEDIVINYPHRKNLLDEDISKENVTRLALIDFLRGLLEFDPVKRWSPLQAVHHPFVTGEHFSCPYRPPPEKPHNPGRQNITVDHNPGGGHWFVAGLSPQVVNVKGHSQNRPHFQTDPSSLASSHVSLGGHGSYNDGAGFGGSYGSYGDSGSTYMYFSPARTSELNSRSQGGGMNVGASPDARCRNSQLPHGNEFGVSPSTENFGPMSLGVSPSQLTPPSSQIHASAGSPGKYGPSPARSYAHVSPLGKVTTVGQSNRRRNLGYSGKSQEIALSQRGQGPHADSISYSQPEGNSHGYVDSSRRLQSSSNHPIPTSRLQRGGNGFSSGSSSTLYQTIPPSIRHGSQFGSSSSSEPSDNSECSTSQTDPGDWIPDYSDELLLEEDISNISSISFGVSNVMHLHHASDTASLIGGIGRFNRTCNLAHTDSSSSSTGKRTKGLVQAFPHPECSPTSVHDTRARYAHPKLLSHHMPHFPQNSPSRFCQRPVQRFSYMQSTSGHSEHSHPKGQLSPFIGITASSHSRGTSTFANGMPWGQRAGHPITTIPPTSHPHKDYGRIT